MKRGLFVLAGVTAAELTAVVVWLVVMDRRISKFSDLIEEACA